MPNGPLRELQKQADSLYQAKKALELELILRRDTPPLAFVRPPEPFLPFRLLGLWIPRLGRVQAERMLRKSGLVDADWYRARYPDVVSSGTDPVRHYLNWGFREERDPSPYFSTSFYLRLHPDVAASGINPLLHYLRFGWAEGRRIHPAPSEHGKPVGLTLESAPRDASPQPVIQRFDTLSLPLVALQSLTEAQRSGPLACIGPTESVPQGDLPAPSRIIPLTRQNLLEVLATVEPGRFVVNVAGLRQDPEGAHAEWAGLWSTDAMRLNRQIMDACRIALDRGWRLQVVGPVNRATLPLFRTVAGVMEVVTPPPAEPKGAAE